MAKSSNTVKRVYTGGDASMLTALAVIMGVATTPAIKTFLKSKRSNWTDASLKALSDAVTAAFKDVLGIDGLGNQTKASKELYKAMEEVLPKLTSFKRQVEIDFDDDNREKEILNSLGFGLWKKVQTGSQEALVELLATFDENMTPALQTEITTAGTDVAYITSIRSYAATIRDKNIAQEGKKGERKTITNDGIVQLNKVYNDVMKVAKTAAILYTETNDKLTAEKFSYAKTLATLTNNGVVKGGGGKGGNGGMPEAGE